MINLIASICKYVSTKKDYISKYYTITSQNQGSVNQTCIVLYKKLGIISEGGCSSVM